MFASEALFRIKNSIERGSTRPFALYGRAEVARAFAAAGFQVTEERPQFFLPMALYRLGARPRWRARRRTSPARSG